MTVGSHVVIHVRWPASLAIKAGTGELHVWTKADLILDKGTLTGSARPCGSVIPALTKTDVVGGGMVQVRIPDAVWDAPSMPVFQVRGRLGGSRVGAAISMEPVASLVGCTMGDPMSDPWPPSAADLDAVDDDGDGQPGIKGVPRKDAPYSEPPLDLGGVLDPHGKRADEVYLATRTILSLAGTRDSCSTATGTADVTSVDSHVVGCHVRGDGICTRSQSDFVDGAQPAFTIESGTFEMVEVPATATCEDVRAALP